MATTEPVVFHHGREGDDSGHDEARPTAATACWAASRSLAPERFEKVLERHECTLLVVGLALAEERSLEVRLKNDNGEVVVIPTKVSYSIQSWVVKLEKIFLQRPGFGT